MQAFILAGGFGSRLRPVIADRPKPMADIGNKPFLEILIRNLAKSNVTDIVLGVGYLSEQIENYFNNGKDFGVKIRYSREEMPLGTAGAIRNAMSLMEDNFLVLNGDTFIDVDIPDLIEHHQKHKASISIVLTRQGLSEKRGSVLVGEDGKIISFNEVSDTTAGVQDFTNAGVYMMNKSVIKTVSRHKKVSLETHLIPSLIWAGENISGYIVDNNYIDIGTPERYYSALTVLRETSFKKKVSLQKIREHVGRAGLRISFAGGGTDMESFYQKYGGQIISSSIDIEVTSSITKTKNKKEPVTISLVNYNETKSFFPNELAYFKGDNFDIAKATITEAGVSSGINIRIESNAPPQSGLGTSSATVIAILRSIYKMQSKEVSPEEIAQQAIKVERHVLNQQGGIQDQYQISYGGFNEFKISKEGKVKVSRIDLSPDTIKSLNDSLILYYIKRDNRGSGQQISLNKNIQTNEKAVQSLLETIKISKKVKHDLEHGDLDGFGRLLNKAWQLKRQTNKLISNSKIDQIYDKLISAGALGGKLLGAGGGGCLLIYSPQTALLKVKDVLKKYDGEIISFHFS
ncbi:MAG: Nucleoside-diphosphate-sugar pyrophosphorylase [Parcubacteria group bacterium GW2011_GWB1_40_14]|nr:MAG: Nucleoside-diphosphate-sugar pyrophosphorylase [Parcubacteria group bacterium GW2011_GWB1_40_14]